MILIVVKFIRSLLSWERGLKYFDYTDSNGLMMVAPLVGAWIEIYGIDLKSTLLSRSSRGSVD